MVLVRETFDSLFIYNFCFKDFKRLYVINTADELHAACVKDGLQ
jgi:hypothetical protein